MVCVIGIQNGFKKHVTFLTTDLSVTTVICRATRKICFLSTIHGHLPSPSYKTFFPVDTGFSYLLSKASWSKYIFAEIRIYANTLQRACARDVICPCCRGAKSANKSVRKILNKNWNMIALHYMNAFKNTTVRVTFQSSLVHPSGLYSDSFSCPVIPIVSSAGSIVY